MRAERAILLLCGFFVLFVVEKPVLHAAIPASVESTGREIVDAAYRVHSALGPGLLESAYEHSLAYELEMRGVGFRRQVPMPVRYRDVLLDAGYRIDLLVDDAVIVEAKAVEAILPIHQAQILTYLRLSECRLGFLINFNVSRIKDGIRRVVL